MPMQEMWVQTIGQKEDHWRRKWQPTPLFVTSKFHRQRSLAVYRPWGHKESDMTEPLSTHTK